MNKAPDTGFTARKYLWVGLLLRSKKEEDCVSDKLSFKFEVTIVAGMCRISFLNYLCLKSLFLQRRK